MRSVVVYVQRQHIVSGVLDVQTGYLCMSPAHADVSSCPYVLRPLGTHGASFASLESALRAFQHYRSRWSRLCRHRVDGSFYWFDSGAMAPIGDDIEASRVVEALSGATVNEFEPEQGPGSCNNPDLVSSMRLETEFPASVSPC